MKRYLPDVLKIYSRFDYARVNMVGAAVGGAYQYRRKDVGLLAREKKLRRHNPNGDGVLENRYPHHWHRIHSLPSTTNHFGWHAVRTSDFALSLEAACRIAQLDFEDLGTEIILPASISDPKIDRGKAYDRPVRADRFVRIGTDYYAIEIDCNTESVATTTFINRKTWHRSILQWADIYSRETFKSHFPHLRTLNVLETTAKRDTIERYMKTVLKLKSQKMLFIALPELADSMKCPEPLLDILTRPWLRVGYDEPYFLQPK